MIIAPNILVCPPYAKDRTTTLYVLSFSAHNNHNEDTTSIPTLQLNWVLKKPSFCPKTTKLVNTGTRIQIQIVWFQNEEL